MRLSWTETGGDRRSEVGVKQQTHCFVFRSHIQVQYMEKRSLDTFVCIQAPSSCLISSHGTFVDNRAEKVYCLLRHWLAEWTILTELKSSIGNYIVFWCLEVEALSVFIFAVCVEDIVLKPGLQGAGFIFIPLTAGGRKCLYRVCVGGGALQKGADPSCLVFSQLLCQHGNMVDLLAWMTGCKVLSDKSF